MSCKDLFKSESGLFGVEVANLSQQITAVNQQANKVLSSIDKIAQENGWKLEPAFIDSIKSQINEIYKLSLGESNAAIKERIKSILLSHPLFKKVDANSLDQIIFSLTDYNNNRFGTKHDLYWILTVLYPPMKSKFQNEMTQLEKLSGESSAINNKIRKYTSLQEQPVLKDVRTEEDIRAEINARIDFLKTHIPPQVLKRIKELATAYNKQQQPGTKLANGNILTTGELNSKQEQVLNDLAQFMSSDPFFLDSTGRPKSDISNFRLQLSSMANEIVLVKSLASDFMDANIRENLPYEISVLMEAQRLFANR